MNVKKVGLLLLVFILMSSTTPFFAHAETTTEQVPNTEVVKTTIKPVDGQKVVDLYKDPIDTSDVLITIPVTAELDVISEKEEYVKVRYVDENTNTEWIGYLQSKYIGNATQQNEEPNEESNEESNEEPTEPPTELENNDLDSVSQNEQSSKDSSEDKQSDKTDKKQQTASDNQENQTQITKKVESTDNNENKPVAKESKVSPKKATKSSNQSIFGIGLSNPINIYSQPSSDSQIIKSYDQGSLLKYEAFTDDWYECTVFIKGKATKGYIKKDQVEQVTDNQKVLSGIGIKSPTKIYSKASGHSSVIKVYDQGSVLKYKSLTSNWYECTVYINGKAKRGFINKNDVENTVSDQKVLHGVGIKSLTKIYLKASKGAKVIKSYAQGTLLKYETFTSGWYECTVFVNGKARTGYINKNDVKSPVNSSQTLHGIGLHSSTKVYVKASTDSGVLKSYSQGSILKYETFIDGWYKCTVYVHGKPTIGYIYQGDVETIVSKQETLYGDAIENPTRVYAKPSTNSKVLKSYKKGTQLKYQTFTSGWYECTVYINGKPTTGYINAKPTVGIQGKVIVIDPGHGGIDPGARAVDGTNEKTINLSYSKVVKASLEKQGAHVVMTHEGDSNCKYGATGYPELQCRVDVAKNNHADLFISIHSNSSTSSYVHGVETHYNDFNDPEYPGVNDKPEASKKLAEIVQRQIVPALGETDRGTIDDNLYVTRNNTVPAILIEIGFISNYNDLQRIENSTIRSRFANALTNAIKNYFQ